MGPTIVYRERTNEELESLFYTIINDKDFLRLCQEEFHKNSFSSLKLPTNQCDYEDISSINSSKHCEGQIVHEINMSVYYNVEIGRDNGDLKFIKRSINIIPEENETMKEKNRFSNLNLSNDIDRLVQMHDYVRHRQRRQQQPQQQPTENKKVSAKRRATISSFSDKKNEFDAVALERIVEQQLEAARRAGSLENFNPIDNSSSRTQTTYRTKFVQPPTLKNKTQDDHINEKNITQSCSRHQTGHIEHSKNHIQRKALSFVNNIVSATNNERKKLLLLGQQSIRSSAMALGTQKIPDHIKSIDLLEIPSTKKTTNQHQDYHLISYETLDNSSNSANLNFRRTKSLRHSNSSVNISNKSLSTIFSDEKPSNTKLTTPLKNIKRHIQTKNSTAIQNRKVSKEKSDGRR